MVSEPGASRATPSYFGRSGLFSRKLCAGVAWGSGLKSKVPTTILANAISQFGTLDFRPDPSVVSALLRRHVCRVVGLHVDDRGVGGYAALAADDFYADSGVVRVRQSHRFEQLRVLDVLIRGELDLR